eukprot:CAMPEP_0184753520 /NCGR_PEP_ID=MMETSP0315-20130426/44145_1 /TAXON_ID=101924 /ORGANISM="Rhodosorus marinus, Strain UTEX LB 2760" /LENGTH=352 /DNA_ID=CAMNT_0027232901 /DNA_START=52 /DNA_END=1113 /DNA_ORIENTATION=+
MGGANGAVNLWDTETQEVHGGQTWRLCEEFVEDFSVTTNPLGPPTSAMEVVKEVLPEILHYPAADCGEALAALSKLIKFPKNQLLLGNGASEFIDLVMRAGPPGPFKPGPYVAAYMEYNRAATAADREILPFDSPEDAGITVIIHPNSPTGDCMSLEDIENEIKKTKGMIVLDESFIANYGPNWHEVSGLRLIEKYPEQLAVICSWTKLWACPGLRLGSIATGAAWYNKLKKLQTPWSCSVLAQAFCKAAASDTEYMERTWNDVHEWKVRQTELVKSLRWKIHPGCVDWVPYIFVDCFDEAVAERASDVAQAAGCPVRLCASFGTPTYLRLGVRRPEKQDVLFEALRKAFPA